MKHLYIFDERFNDKNPIAVHTGDGLVSARFASEAAAREWATRNHYEIKGCKILKPVMLDKNFQVIEEKN